MAGKRAPNTTLPNMAKSKNVARKKTVVKKETAGTVDFDLIQNQKDPDKRKDEIRNELQRSPYVSLSDLFVNIRRGGGEALSRLEKMIVAEAKTGQGVRTWRIKMVVNEDGSAPVPGQVVTWVRQRYNRLDYGTGRKIGTTEANDMTRRGDGHMLTEEAEVVLDKDCCFDCTYSDAVDILSKWGIYYLNFDPLADREEDHPVSGMKRVTRTGHHNWRYVEVPPGFFDDTPGFFAKKRQRKTEQEEEPSMESMTEEAEKNNE